VTTTFSHLALERRRSEACPSLERSRTPRRRHSWTTTTSWSAVRRRLLLVSVAGALAFVGLWLAIREGPRAAAAPSGAVENVVLVTIDGVRWQEIFRGVDPARAEAALLPKSAVVPASELLPNMTRLFFEGGTVLGDPSLAGGFSPSGPRYVSLPGYVELMTGATSECTTNDCIPSLGTTLPEELARGLATSPGEVAVLASWEVIARVSTGDRPGVLIVAGSAEGDEAPPYPGHGDYRADRATRVLAIRHLVERRPRFMWVALGDTDEWAHRGDYRGYLGALRAADAFVGELAAHLAEMGDYGRNTALFVTTDHGRGASFADHGEGDSATTWLLARGPGIAARGPSATASARYLRDVAPTIRRLLQLPAHTCATCGEAIPELLP